MTLTAPPPETRAPNTDLGWLGDPFAPDNPAGFAQAVARSRRGVRPVKVLERARRAGLHLIYTPRIWGGALEDPVAAGRIARTLVARDADIMTNLLMSLTPVLITGLLGDDAQRADVVATVVRGGHVGYALSERRHGSDLLNLETRAEHDGERITLTGRKWWVGQAPTAERFVVIARSGERGPLAFSAYDVPAPALGLAVRPPHATAGFRGTEFSDVDLDGVVVPGSALLGERGAALGAVLTSQSIVRTLSLPAALACMDADRLLLTRLSREIRGGKALRDDVVFLAEVGRIAARVLAAEAVAEAALREMATDPASAVLRSAFAKHVVSRCTQEVHDLVGDALSTRGIAGDGAWGMHDKVVSDARAIRVIDGSPLATLRTVAGFLPRCVADAGDEPPTGDRDADPRRFDPARVAMTPPRRDEAVALLRRDEDAIRATPDGASRAPIGALVAALDDSARRIGAAASAARELRPAALLAETRRHAWLSSAASAVVARRSGLVGPVAARIGGCSIPLAVAALLEGAGIDGVEPSVAEAADLGRALLDAGDDELREWGDDA
ncbi:acyl-CoA dehydrogenase family protein [Clavibacter seminis]|uniref:Acyl-CoA dehydrogenase family protein n=3 Tax=Clavibacter TaxID=1573 RepID=A0ABY3T811_9MICO|nr:acyl-CoA dehydrogenase family protein [Clavibacter sp. A6099]UKF25305.1 acyl-CoA dehydrogenase family protein [Clavibacter sp. A6099]